MKLIVGLGNPGEKYQNNRHNVGFMVVDELLNMLQTVANADRSRAQGSGLAFSFSKKFNAEILQTKELIVAKPQTFMNESGKSVAEIAHFYKIHRKNIYIVHDDLDIALGNYKICFGHGPKVHNGLKSVREYLANHDFWYVKVGVENREVRGNGGVPGVVYSLQDFSGAERKTIDVVITKIVDELIRVVS